MSAYRLANRPGRWMSVEVHSRRTVSMRRVEDARLCTTISTRTTTAAHHDSIQGERLRAVGLRGAGYPPAPLAHATSSPMACALPHFRQLPVWRETIEIRVEVPETLAFV